MARRGAVLLLLFLCLDGSLALPSCGDASGTMWRQTGHCSGDCDNARESDNDAPGTATIAPTRSGYCECSRCQGGDGSGLRGRIHRFDCNHLPLKCSDVCSYTWGQCADGYAIVQGHLDPLLGQSSDASGCSQCAALCDNNTACGMYQCGPVDTSNCTQFSSFGGRPWNFISPGRIAALLCVDSTLPMPAFDANASGPQLGGWAAGGYNASCVLPSTDRLPPVEVGAMSRGNSWKFLVYLVVGHVIVFAFLFTQLYMTNAATQWTCQCVPYVDGFDTYHTYHAIGRMVPPIQFDKVDYFNSSGADNAHCGDTYMGFRIKEMSTEGLDEYEFPPRQGDYVITMDCKRVEQAFHVAAQLDAGISDSDLLLLADMKFKTHFDRWGEPWHMMFLRKQNHQEEDLMDRISTLGAMTTKKTSEKVKEKIKGQNEKVKEIKGKLAAKTGNTDADKKENRGLEEMSFLQTHMSAQVQEEGKRRRRRRVQSHHESGDEPEEVHHEHEYDLVLPVDRPSLHKQQRPHSSETGTNNPPVEQLPALRMGMQQFSSTGSNKLVIILQTVLFLILLTVSLSFNTVEYMWKGILSPLPNIGSLKPKGWVQVFLPFVAFFVALALYVRYRGQAASANMEGRHQVKDLVFPCLIAVLGLVFLISLLYHYAKHIATTNQHEIDWASIALLADWLAVSLTSLYFMFVLFMIVRKWAGILTPPPIDYETADMLLASEAVLSAIVDLIVNARHTSANGGSCAPGQLFSAMRAAGPKELLDTWGDGFGQVDCSMNSGHLNTDWYPLNRTGDPAGIHIWGAAIPAGMSCDVFCDEGLSKTVGCYDYGGDGGQWIITHDARPADLSLFCCDFKPCPRGSFESAPCTRAKQRVCSRCSADRCAHLGLAYNAEACGLEHSGCFSHATSATPTPTSTPTPTPTSTTTSAADSASSRVNILSLSRV